MFERVLEEVYQALRVPGEAYQALRLVNNFRAFINKLQANPQGIFFRVSNALFGRKMASQLRLKKGRSLGAVLLLFTVFLATLWLRAKRRKR